MNCTNDCTTIQIIDEGSSPNLNEKGEVALAIGQVELSVTFLTPKASASYRFEYLYVDAFGETNPGAINPVVVTQTAYGFSVKLAAAPPVEGYVLRWHVVVVDISSLANIDAPESFRVQIPSPGGTIPIPVPPQFAVMEVFFQNPRSNTTYGFTELRVENLVDDPTGPNYSVVWIYVCEKNLTSFKVAFVPVPPTANYFLVGRTP